MFARILEWSFVDKGLLLALLIPLFFQYILWSIYTLGREDRALLVDPVFLLSQMPLLWLFLGGAVCMLLAGLLLRRLNRPPSLFTHLCVYYFALTLVY